MSTNINGVTFDLWAVEDYLQQKHVFRNGLNDRDAHMDSYMTVLDYVSLDVALKVCPFSKEEMLACCDNWEGSSYLSPIHKLLSLIVRNYYSK